MLLGLAVLFTVAAVEVLFRLAVFPDWRSLAPKVTVRHPVYGHYSAPNLAVRRFSPPDYDVVNHTNSLGFRDREAGIDEDLAGIWVLGDSNAFGGGLQDDEIFAAVLQFMGRKVANMASEGPDMTRMARVAKDMARRGHRPRAILYVGSLNAFIRDMRDSLAHFDDPLPAAEAPARTAVMGPAATWLAALRAAFLQHDAVTLLGLKTRLIRNSAAYGWVKVAANGVPALRRMFLRLGWRADRDLVPSGFTPLLARDLGERARVRIDSTADFAARLAEWTRARFGVPFAMVLLPTQHDLYPARFARFLAAAGLDPAAYRADLARTRLAAALAARGVPMLDLYNALEAHAGESLTFLDDAHFNRRGNRIIAEAIDRWLSHDLGLRAGG
ncbi:MAG: hypothetical protein H6907_02270 [Hyphomicrobiales bacterium]|nr:hypothetical protein [Hyphomicrobiales bacterium]MCP5370532.1 hypothetical protein [Hyphomicrobiales bacterium]